MEGFFSLLFTCFEDDELGGGCYLLDAAEQPRQLAVITQMTVADDVQRAAHHQRFTRLLEHPPGQEIADHLLLVKRRIAQHHVKRLRFLACLLYTSPSPRDLSTSRMPSSA